MLCFKKYVNLARIMDFFAHHIFWKPTSSYFLGSFSLCYTEEECFQRTTMGDKLSDSHTSENVIILASNLNISLVKYNILGLKPVF